TKVALDHYLQLEKGGDAKTLPRIKKSIQPGEAYANLPELGERLRQLGDLSQPQPQPQPQPKPPSQSNDSSADVQAAIYQGDIVDAVKRFQARHGLAADGSLGAQTIQQLNVPLHRRVTQLRLALERWRWLPHDLPPRFLSVNIPGFELYGFENHHVSLTMPVVVGKAFPGDKKTALPEDIHQTPVFMDDMEYIIFRPYWNVPVNITRKEILPELKKDPGYLNKHQY